jgi:antitoxin (DNA-binding transcriptional repressor) of toxin-antitoxin stability system
VQDFLPSFHPISNRLAWKFLCVIICVVKTASVYEVQHHFSRVLTWVAAGKTVVINRHRVPVAKLVPADAPRSPVPLPDFMARMKKDFGGKVFPDSQPLLDEMRRDRY